jgi:hypothetical protein
MHYFRANYTALQYPHIKHPGGAGVSWDDVQYCTVTPQISIESQVLMYVAADARARAAHSYKSQFAGAAHGTYTTDARGFFIRSFPSALPTFGDFKGKGKKGERRSERGSTNTWPVLGLGLRTKGASPFSHLSNPRRVLPCPIQVAAAIEVSFFNMSCSM